MIRKAGKVFLATLPPEIHAVLRADASARKSKSGGQLSINRALVNALFIATKSRMTPEQRAAVESFLTKH